MLSTKAGLCTSTICVYTSMHSLDIPVSQPAQGWKECLSLVMIPLMTVKPHVTNSAAPPNGAL